MPDEKREWTLDTARSMLPEVRTRTGRAAKAVEELSEERERCEEGTAERRAVEERIQEHVSRWLREMEALGVVAKGLWLVDFDNGSGYYCWLWPEEDLAFFHGYDEGFDGRVRIQ